MELTIYQVDAFTSRLFGGNPAAVCPLTSWLPDTVMQQIAAENNLSETAFFVAQGGSRYHIRWFTPTKEVKLCGHATLASAFVLYRELGVTHNSIEFDSLSGILRVCEIENKLELDFPSATLVAVESLPVLKQALNYQPIEIYREDDYLLVFESEQQIADLEVNFTLLKTLDLRGVIATAPGKDVNFVSRFFAPNYGIEEDPATGSAHCELMPYWVEKLGKTTLRATQISKRTGEFDCELVGTRVKLRGDAVLYMKATVFLSNYN